MAQLNDWLTIDKTSGTGNAEITLSASSYEELVERTATIKVQGINTNAILTVKQEALELILNVEGELSFSSLGGTTLFYVTSNVDWYIEDGDWYSFNRTNGYKNNRTNINITVTPNGGNKREIQIPIYATNSGSIIGYIPLKQSDFNAIVETPTDVENCFYIEPNITDGRIVNVCFNNTFDSVSDGFNWLTEGVISYFEDGTWKEFRIITDWDEFPVLQIQKRTYFKGLVRRNDYKNIYLKFNITDEYNVGGDLTTLLGEMMDENYAKELFAYTSVVDVSNLIFPNEVGAGAYIRLFGNCVNLTTSPAILPALSLSTYCYLEMFYRCTSLTTAPILPASVLKNGCYQGMFYGCSNLTHIEMLGAIVGEESLYKWVYGVSESGSFIKAKNANLPIDSQDGVPSGWSVTESVVIPTTEQLKSSYVWVEFEDTNGEIGSLYNKGIVYSFDGVEWNEGSGSYWRIYMGNNRMVYLANTQDTTHTNTKFSTFTSKAKIGGKLDKITTNCSELFKNNVNLTDASELILPTTITEACFVNMFGGCSSLIKAPALPATVLAKYCYRSMFGGCSSLIEAPALPATVLAEYCYDGMFSGCTSLTKAPILPAPILVNECYRGMFSECSNLNYIKMLAYDGINIYRLFYWVRGVSQTGTFVKHPDAVLSSGENGIPNGWTVETATI